MGLAYREDGAAATYKTEQNMRETDDQNSPQ